MKRAELTYQWKGDQVVMTNNAPKDTQLKPKDILESIDGLKNNLENYKQKRLEAEKAFAELEEGEKWNLEQLKELQKFESKAVEWQVSKLKALLEEVKEECQLKVLAEYKHDDLLTEQQNELQKYAIYKHKLATHPKISSEIAKGLIQKFIYVEPVITNPFK